MAGRPRTMLKRVAGLMERQQEICDELMRLGKHYMPAEGEPWNFDMPGGACDPLPSLWRKAAFKAGCVSDYLGDVLSYLEMKAEKAAANSPNLGAPDDPDDEVIANDAGELGGRKG